MSLSGQDVWGQQKGPSSNPKKTGFGAREPLLFLASHLGLELAFPKEKLTGLPFLPTLTVNSSFLLREIYLVLPSRAP